MSAPRVVPGVDGISKVAALAGSGGDPINALIRGVSGVFKVPGPLTGAVKQAIRDALVGHIVDGWPRTIPPSGHAVLAYRIADPNYRLSVTIDYQDEAGYQWRRTDTGQPTRLDGIAAISTNRSANA